MSKQKEVAKTGIEAAKEILAPKAQQETALALSKQEAEDQYGGALTASDFTIPRLTVLEGLSPQVKEKSGYPGDMFVSGINENLGSDPVEFVILKRLPTSRLRWKPLKEGGGLLCIAENGKTGVARAPEGPGGDCFSCPFKSWSVSEKGEQVAPECDENQNFMVVPRASLTSGQGIPFVLSGSRSRLKEFKNLNTMLLPLMSRNLPLYAKSVIIRPMAKTSKLTNTEYHVFTFSWGNNNALLPQEEAAAAARLLAQFGGAKVADVETIQAETEQAPL
jgi:hypothetical protein